MAGNHPEVILNISSGVTLTNIETRWFFHLKYQPQQMLQLNLWPNEGAKSVVKMFQ